MTRRKGNKYEYVHVLQGEYGWGFEDLVEDVSRKVVRDHMREYQVNEGGTYRIIERRNLIKNKEVEAA